MYDERNCAAFCPCSVENQGVQLIMTTKAARSDKRTGITKKQPIAQWPSKCLDHIGIYAQL